MPIEIIREREDHKSVEFFLDFCLKDDKSCGFCFPCDESGKVDESALEPAGLENWKRCQSDSNIIREGVRREVNRWTDPKVGRCVCGEEVDLDGFTNPCYECGREYNWNGDMLTPRDQWEEPWDEP